MKKPWRRNKSWLEHAGTPGTLGGAAPAKPENRIERAMKSERGNAESGVAEYAAFAAASEKVPAPPPPSEVREAPEPTEKSSPPPQSGVAEEHSRAAAREDARYGKDTAWGRQMIEEVQRQRALLHQERETTWKLKAMLDDPELRAARAELIRGITGLVPKALADARQGKPGLLRLIARAVGIRKTPQKLPGS